MLPIYHNSPPIGTSVSAWRFSFVLSIVFKMIPDDKKLTYEEIYALMQLGRTMPEIARTDLDAFDRLYYKKQEQLDEWLRKAEKIFDKQQSLGITTVTCQDADYPALLMKIGADAPPMIHLSGNKAVLKKCAVAVVGARAADRTGLEAAYRLGHHYASEGEAVISGLALGCDMRAHEGCLDAGGETIAIVANGLDSTHPIENKYLQDRILKNRGLLLSEQTVGVKANPATLVARNRLQAALSHSVVLAQCPEKSGSMHTMRFGRRYGKTLLAVEPRQVNFYSGGNRLLIEKGVARAIIV